MTVVVCIIIILFCSCFIMFIDIKSLQEKNRNLEMKLSQLADKTGNPECSIYVDDNTLVGLKALKNQGKFTKAVKKLRENTPYNLIDAKKYIEML